MSSDWRGGDAGVADRDGIFYSILFWAVVKKSCAGRKKAGRGPWEEKENEPPCRVRKEGCGIFRGGQGTRPSQGAYYTVAAYGMQIRNGGVLGYLRFEFGEECCLGCLPLFLVARRHPGLLCHADLYPPVAGHRLEDKEQRFGGPSNRSAGLIVGWASHTTAGDSG